MPKISVIIPVYNTETDFIKSALDSLHNQTLQDLEIIIVNDGSTNPDTCNYLKRLKLKSNTILLNQKNMGQSAARNAGLDVATGDFIGFLDSDDWLAPDFYETLYKKCIQNDADMACGVLRVCDGDQITDLDTFNNEITSDVTAKLANITNGSVCSKIFKRNMFENIRFPVGLYYEDNLTLLELLLKSKKIVFDSTVQYNYRANPYSTVHDDKRRQKRINDSIVILSKINNIANQHQKSERDVIVRTFLKILFMRREYKSNKEYREQINNIFPQDDLRPFTCNKKLMKFITKIKSLI